MYSAESKHAEEKGEGDAKATWNQINFDEIELGKKIGGGGVGVIYSGRWNGKPVALKTLFDPKVDEALMQEYMDELLVMSKLNHPNVVAFLGACMTPPNLCFVMELCDQSLFDMLHVQRAPFTPYERVQIASDTALGMQYLHSQHPPVIHRDLKSHNLLVFRGVVKLCDFGLVRTKNTKAGTPIYMAPELLEGKSFNKSVDVYSFGILLYELFSGDIPFNNYDFDDIKTAVCRGDRPRVPTIDTPPAIRAMIEACWQHDPLDRPSFSSIVRDIDQLLREMPQRSNLDELDMGGGGDALDDLLGGLK